MTNPKSTLRLFISTDYDCCKMPGYVTIPFNFEFGEFKEFFYRNIDEILNIKRRVGITFLL